MAFSVRAKGDTVATFRFASVFAMETLARWIPVTPELEVKIVFGRHVWEFAQHADALGKRTGELRLALQYSRPPTPQYLEVLETLAAANETGDRVDGFYRGLLPIMAAGYQAYLDQTDHLMDEPSVRIIERILRDFERMESERAAMTAEIADSVPVSTGLADRLLTMVDVKTDLVDFRPVPPAEAG